MAPCGPQHACPHPDRTRSLEREGGRVRCRCRRLRHEAISNGRGARTAASTYPARRRPRECGARMRATPPRYAQLARHSRRRSREAHGAGIPVARLPPPPSRPRRVAHGIDRASLRSGFRSGFEHDRGLHRTTEEEDWRRVDPDRSWARLPAHHAQHAGKGPRGAAVRFNSLAFRLVAGAGLWIAAALIAGGLALSSIFEDSVERSFDARLEVYLDGLIAVSRTGAAGRLELARGLGEPRFTQPYSGWYWEI